MTHGLGPVKAGPRAEKPITAESDIAIRFLDGNDYREISTKAV